MLHSESKIWNQIIPSKPVTNEEQRSGKKSQKNQLRESIKREPTDLLAHNYLFGFIFYLIGICN